VVDIGGKEKKKVGRVKESTRRRRAKGGAGEREEQLWDSKV
jgi:hypothetical protein